VTARRTRVLMVTDSLAVGGAEQVAVDLANTLDRSTYEVRVCATRDSGPLESRLAADVETVVLNRPNTWDVGGFLRFVKLVNGTGTDIIHSHGRGTLRFVALARVLGLIRAKHVFHDHFGWFNLDRNASLDVRVALRRGIDAYLGTDSRLCSWAVHTAGMDPQRTFLVRSGVDLTRFADVEPIDLREQFGLRDDQVLMIMLANIRHPKDHPTLLRAVAELPRELQDRLKLVLVGSTGVDPAYEAGCKAMIVRLGIERCIEIYGRSEQPAGLLAGADAAVLSSKNETGPLVVLEYMASGLPFVATDTGEITHAVRGLGAGFVPQPRDHHALADAIAALLHLTADERAAMGQRGRQLAEEVFDQHIVTRGVEQIYELLLGRRDRTDLILPEGEGSRLDARPRPVPA